MKRKKHDLRCAAALTVIGLVFLLSGCGKGESLVIGTQTFSEPKILAQMHKLLIESRTNIHVDVLPDLASSTVVAQALRNNDIQMGVLYSGMIFDNYFPVVPTNNRAEVLKQAQQGFNRYFNLHWFDPYGFENTYAFTMLTEAANQYKFDKISDVAPKAADMTLGVDTTWLERGNDGYPAFKKHYGFEFGKTRPMEVALVYKAVATKSVDIVLAYSTDPRIKEFNLKALKDDKQFFPPYDASPVIRNEVLDKHPELEELISLLKGKINAQTMIDLNYEVDVKKRNENKVAEEYLRKIGLLSQA